MDTLPATSRLSERQWAGLPSRYGTKGAVEAVMLAGHYFMLAGLLNSTDTQIEPGLEARIRSAEVASPLSGIAVSGHDDRPVVRRPPGFPRRDAVPERRQGQPDV
ncbi:hypothetical protein [Streptomyces resistomycificus]|uniref:Uncharacterized protein n=1 Tax=Streptomyces resistomycificus TaxID=67356 RepID=A0A0L8LGK9_9ACTN|nr:hypothetical protein [Streptomyces resistomycificus]KOG37239.1 hypothetical protein ADK37_12695 [Streptomyces resistomycificus]KUN95198.1 hypothetical protein AQJ84_24415 [Streptomyces resistomycificus]